MRENPQKIFGTHSVKRKSKNPKIYTGNTQD